MKVVNEVNIEKYENFKHKLMKNFKACNMKNQQAKSWFF